MSIIETPLQMHHLPELFLYLPCFNGNGRKLYFSIVRSRLREAHERASYKPLSRRFHLLNSSKKALKTAENTWKQLLWTLGPLRLHFSHGYNGSWYGMLCWIVYAWYRCDQILFVPCFESALLHIPTVLIYLGCYYQIYMLRTVESWHSSYEKYVSGLLEDAIFLWIEYRWAKWTGTKGNCG